MKTSKKRLYTTINAGKYKGKKIFLPSSSTTRSTKSILKGSFFDSVQYQIVDKVMVEVFGGSGSMGFEALSRGASEAYFIERDKEAFKVLVENAQNIDPDSAYALQGDCFEVYPKVAEKLKDKNKSSFLYFDPPFDIRDGMEGIYEKVIGLIENTPAEIVELIAIEHMTNYDLPEKIGEYELVKERKFGRSKLSYYQ